MKTGTLQETVTIRLNDTGSAVAMLRMALWNAKASEIPGILTHLEAIKTHLWSKLMQGDAPESPRVEPVAAEQYLTVDQVCERFQVTARWLYRHKARMPHSQPSRKQLIFPERAITKWFASRRTV